MENYEADECWTSCPVKCGFTFLGNFGAWIPIFMWQGPGLPCVLGAICPIYTLCCWAPEELTLKQ